MGAPSDQFLRLLYGGPTQVSFIVCCMGAPPPPPQISFFGYYVGSPSGQFLCIPCGPPPKISFFYLLYRSHPQVSFFAYYVEAPDPCLCTPYEAPLDQFSFFFFYYNGAPYISFLVLPWQFFSFHFLRIKLSLRVPHIFEFLWGGGKCPLLPPPPPVRVPMSGFINMIIHFTANSYISIYFKYAIKCIKLYIPSKQCRRRFHRIWLKKNQHFLELCENYILEIS